MRFGADKLRVEKEIDPRTLGVLVPSILLQPLIENSIKHGLEPRLTGGTVTLRSRLEGDRVLIEVADDGVGMGNRPGLDAQPHRRRHRHEKRAGAAGGALRQPGAASAWSAIQGAARWSRLRFRRICRKNGRESHDSTLRKMRERWKIRPFYGEKTDFSGDFQRPNLTMRENLGRKNFHRH